MKDQSEIIKEDEIVRTKFLRRIEKSLCNKLKIPTLRAGNITLRDDRNWRINEKQIDYCWLVNVTRSFVGCCWLFSIKFNKTSFRKINNSEELIQGIFTVTKEGNIAEYFSETRGIGFQDSIKLISNLELYQANKGITLDGTRYEYLIFAPNTKIRIKIRNPTSENWQKWENLIWKLGEELSEKIELNEIREVFK